MYTQPFWIEGQWPGRLAVSARPRGGDWLEDEIKQWRQQRRDVPETSEQLAWLRAIADRHA